MKYRKYLFAFFALSVCTTNLHAQQTNFDPFSGTDSELYHLDFTQYFKNENEEAEDLKQYYLLLNHFNSLKGNISLSAQNLLLALALQDSIQIKYFRHYIYHNLLYSTNRENTKNRDLSNIIDEAFNSGTAFFETELAIISPHLHVKYIMQEPALKKYQFYIQNLSRSKPHLPDLKDTAAAKLIPSAGWYFGQYDNITRKIKFLDIITPTGKLNVRTDRVIISQNTERKIREDGFVNFYAGYDSVKEQYATTLIGLIKSEAKAAQLRHFKSAAEKYYFDKYHSEKTVNLILQQIVDSVSIYKRYQQLRVQNKKKQTGLDEVHYWDMQFSPNQFIPRFTIDTAQKIILTALKPIGAVYQNELFELLNPANRRMEIAPGKNKRQGGFSRGYIGTASIFYSAAYKGFYDDVRVITHEATHAVHRQLMNTNHVLPVYAAGPNYLFESFAIFSEFLLSDYLIAHAKSKEEKQYYYEQYFDGKGMAMFSIAPDALLEQEIHKGVINKTIKAAADFEAVSAKVNSLFSIWPAKEYPQFDKRWITASLFYEDPFYEINYVLGAMLALKYYELYKRDGEGFCKKYTALMKNGFNDSPRLLLQKFLGIDINSPDLLTGAMKMTKLKVAELEKIYNGQ